MVIVWEPGAAQTLVEPRQRAVYERIRDELHGAWTSAGTARADAG